MPTFGSLFAGIGGIDLGLERAGWTGRWQVEYEPFCQRVLAKHWPDVPRLGDVHDVHGAAFCPVALAGRARMEEPESVVPDIPRGPSDAATAQAGSGSWCATCGLWWDDCTCPLPYLTDCPNCLPYVDLLAGGFPCQPFSNAGKRRGKDDERWLWPEFARLVGELRPRHVLVENVPGLLAGHGGMGAVLGDLAVLGYDAEWDSIPASAVGAPHLRYRVWIVAHANESRSQGRPVQPERAYQLPAGSGSLADAERGRGVGRPARSGRRYRSQADAGPPSWGGPVESDAWWSTEPDVGRVAHGVPARVDRLRSLGNAVVPQVVEVIGRRILEAEELTV